MGDTGLSPMHRLRSTGGVAGDWCHPEGWIENRLPRPSPESSFRTLGRGQVDTSLHTRLDFVFENLSGKGVTTTLTVLQVHTCSFCHEMGWGACSCPTECGYWACSDQRLARGLDGSLLYSCHLPWKNALCRVAGLRMKNLRPETSLWLPTELPHPPPEAGA